MEQREVSVAIEGMSCDGCVNSVRRVLSRLAGADVREVRVGLAHLVVDESIGNAEVIAAIARAGFRARVAP
jgi:copper chaperone CopZ